MKRLFFSIIAALAILSAPVAQAGNITVEQSKDAAVHFLKHNTYLGKLATERLTLVYQLMNEELNVPSMYFFNVSDGGWIVMAASTAIEPVVAFSDEDSFNPDRMAPATETWFNLYNAIICEVQNLDAEKTLPDNEQWSTLSNHQLTGNTKDTQVKFLASKWDQGDFDGKIYNMFAPKATSTCPGGVYYCPTGCVATALAQICNYYEFPKKARGLISNSYSWSAGETWIYYNGSYQNVTYQSGGGTQRMNFKDSASFDYSLMPNALTARTKEASRREVSRLGWYIGAAVRMQYAPDGSSSNDGKVLEGMPAYFKYTVGTLTNRGNNTATFINRLRADLMRKRPVYMTGYNSLGGEGRDAGGHAWVCGGYMEQDEDFYYMNWGWGGSSDAWYNLRANTQQSMTAGQYAFTDYQSHITGMIPEGDSVGIGGVEQVATLGAAYPNPATYSVKIPYQSVGAAVLTIYNALGQPVETRRVQAGNGEVSVRVDAMPKGIYIYRMGDAYGKFVVR